MIRKPIFIACLGVLLAAGCASGPKAKKAEAHKQKKIELQALKHYRLGIDDYVNTRYAEASLEWKKTLELDPKNANAALYIERAEKAQRSSQALKKTD